MHTLIVFLIFYIYTPVTSSICESELCLCDLDNDSLSLAVPTLPDGILPGRHSSSGIPTCTSVNSSFSRNPRKPELND